MPDDVRDGARGGTARQACVGHNVRILGIDMAGAM